MKLQFKDKTTGEEAQPYNLPDSFFVNAYGNVVEIYEDEDENGALMWIVHERRDVEAVIVFD